VFFVIIRVVRFYVYNARIESSVSRPSHKTRGKSALVCVTHRQLLCTHRQLATGEGGYDHHGVSISRQNTHFRLESARRQKDVRKPRILSSKVGFDV